MVRRKGRRWALVVVVVGIGGVEGGNFGRSKRLEVKGRKAWDCSGTGQARRSQQRQGQTSEVRPIQCLHRLTGCLPKRSSLFWEIVPLISRGAQDAGCTDHFRGGGPDHLGTATTRTHPSKSGEGKATDATLSLVGRS